MSRSSWLVGLIRWGGSPFGLGRPKDQAWCLTCQAYTDVELAVGTRDGVQVGRKRCRRCGHVIAWGIDRTRMHHGTLTAAAIRFVRDHGRDRR